MIKNYSYVTLLTNDSYSYGIILLIESLKNVKTKYPLHVLVTPNVSKAILKLLDQLDLTYEIVDIIPTPEALYERNKKIQPTFSSTWKYCWTKFKIFNLTQFSKIIFLDADIMINKNIDHLFTKKHMTAALDGEYFNIWPGNDHFNSGCLVIEPNEEEYNKILNFANNLDIDSLPQQVVADQEILNLYYKDWPEKKELHLDKYYNIFAPYTQEDQIEELKEKSYFIHFIGRKPWAFWFKNPKEIYSEYFYKLAKNCIEAKLAILDWSKIREQLILTVYAICKNERQNVERWINSFGLADYVCVLDTGSTDGTWEFLQKEAEKRKNLIIAQETINPWRYDKARNKSMTLIPKDTIIFFMADLDEEIKDKDWVQKVKNAWDPLFSRGMYDYHRDLDDKGNIIRTIKEYRIHSNEWTHWKNIVHEAICKDNEEKHFYMESCNKIPIEVWHYAKKCEKNYIELCEQDLEEYPDDWIMRLQLAIEYEIAGNIDKAIEHYKYILSHKNNLQNFEIARCFNGIARQAYKNQNFKVAEQLFAEGRLACDYFADNYIEAMEMYFNNKQYNKVIDLGIIALERCIEAQWCSNYDIKNYYIYYIMGLTYWYIGEEFKSIGYLEYAYNKNPNEDIKKQLLNCCINLQQKLSMIEKNIKF